MVSLHKTVWGERSLTLGELLGFIICLVLIFWKPIGVWSIWIGLILLFLAMMFF